MNRICPSEELLSEYLSGKIPPEAREPLEKHLSSCRICRTLISEAYDILKKRDPNDVQAILTGWIQKNIWLIGATVSLIISFLIPRYFLQFLVISYAGVPEE